MKFVEKEKKEEMRLNILEFTPKGAKITSPYPSLKWSNSFAAPVSTAFVITGVKSDMIIN